MFVTAKHMVGDMKMGDDWNDLNIQWWESQLKTVDAPLARRLQEAATPFAKVQIMFDDMEGWCFEQGKKGETMQTLFWSQLQPHGPVATSEALLGTLEQWWRHQNGDDIPDDKKESLPTRAPFEFDFRGMEAGQPFPRQGVDFRKWVVEAYKDWLRAKLGDAGAFIGNRKWMCFLIGMAIVMVMWSGDLSWLQTLRGYVPQYVLDAIVIVQLGDETLGDVERAVGRPVPQPLAGAIVEVGARQGAVRRQNRDAVRARNQIGAVNNAARIWIQVQAMISAVRAAAGSISSSISLSGMLAVSTGLVTAKLVHDYNRNYQPQRIRAWLQKNTPEFANTWKDQLLACIGEFDRRKYTGLYVFAVNRPPEEGQPLAPPPPPPYADLARMTTAITEDVEGWVAQWTAADAPLPLNGWANRMQLVTNIENRIVRMSTTERELSDDWFMKYSDDGAGGDESNLFPAIKAYVAERDHPDRHKFQADPNVRGDDKRDIKDAWNKCFEVLQAPLQQTVEKRGMPSLLAADDQGNRAWDPAHPSEGDIRQATRDLRAIRTMAIPLSKGMRIANEEDTTPAGLYHAIRNRINAIRFRDGRPDVDMGDCNLPNPQGGGGGGGIPPLAPVPVPPVVGVPVLPGQAPPPAGGGGGAAGGGVAASVVDDVFARLRLR